MTKAELLTDLEAKPDVIWVGTPNLLATTDNLKKYDVPTLRLIDTDFVQGASQPMVVLNEGEATEVAYYNIQKNFRGTAERDQLYTDTQIQNYLNANFPDFDVIEFDVRKDGKMDIIRIKALDNRVGSTTEGNVITVQMAVWNDGGTPNVRILR